MDHWTDRIFKSYQRATPLDAPLRERESSDRLNAFDVGSLIAELDAPTPKERANAARALGRLGNPAAIPPLFRSLHDPDATVRTAAMNALASFSDDTWQRTEIAVGNGMR